jgi:hypothetical protein
MRMKACIRAFVSSLEEAKTRGDEAKAFASSPRRLEV